MVSVGPENENDDPEVDVNAMVAEVGANQLRQCKRQILGHVLKCVLPELLDRMHPANNQQARCFNNCLVCLTMGLIMCLRQIPMVPLLVRRHAPAM